MKKILIVGKNSYIGTELYNYLDTFNKEETVYEVLKISASNGEWMNTDYVGYDAIILLSGMVHKKESSYGYDVYYKVNCEMAEEIAKKAKDSGVKKFIFVSTMAVYGDGVTKIDKETKTNPSTYYGKTKLMAEQKILEMANDQFVVSVVRPPMVYGKGCKGNFARLESLVKKIFIFPKLTNKRSMIYIENLCEFFRLLLECEKTAIYHPQNREYVSTCNMVKEIGKAKKRNIIMVPGFGWIIRIGMKYVRSLSKLFGDCYYDKEISTYDQMDYCIVDGIDSIKKSV